MRIASGEPLLRPVPWPSIPAAFHELAGQRGDAPALLFKRHGYFYPLSWSDYDALVSDLTCGWIELGVGPGERVALLSRNRLEWLATDLALLAAAAVTVPIHPPLASSQIAYQLRHSGACYCAVAGADEAGRLLEATRREKLEHLVGFVALDSSAARTLTGSTDRPVYTWDQLRMLGRRAAQRLAPQRRDRIRALQPDSLATILYTSGTTGEPKGVMLSHHNFLSNAFATLQVLPHPRPGLQMNWLPYSHVFARLADHYQPLLAGTPVAISGGLPELLDDIADQQPTHLTAVPRFYEKVWAELAACRPEARPQRARELMGRRFLWAISGGAALPREIAERLSACGILLLQGYGLTESSPVISVNTPQHNRFGTSGRPIPGVEVAIAEDGEVLTRGPHVMAGYWQNPEATAETIVDGWLHTGDLGELDSDGYLTITGRKKELIVLSTGKNVAPVAVEGALLLDPLIEQVAVIGDNRPYVVALIVPNFAELRARLTAEGRDAPAEDAELVRLPRSRELIEEAVTQRCAELASWEQVKRFALLERPFSIAAEELTPTLKLRRNVVANRYAELIESLYA